MEAPPRFELGNRGFADLCLTTWLCRRKPTAIKLLERVTRFELATFTLARLHSTTELHPHKIWCLRAESNRRHTDFQSVALPTELPRHIGWVTKHPYHHNMRIPLIMQRDKMATPIGLEPTISCVTGRHVNHYTTGPYLVGDDRLELPTPCL